MQESQPLDLVYERTCLTHLFNINELCLNDNKRILKYFIAALEHRGKHILIYHGKSLP